ncbi:MAG: glycerophosphodiester phosphodiesterase [Acidimicrobiales bacterium]
MPPRLPSLRTPPIAFAHRGARAHAPENTLEAFHLAQRLGATGLESDVWLTADGVAVLDHDGVVGGRIRRTSIDKLTHAALPDSIPTLPELYRECGTDFELSLDVKDVKTIDSVIEAAEAAGDGALGRLWLCHWDLDVLASWRSRWTGVRLVHSTRMGRLDRGPERHAADLARLGIDAVNLHHTEWSGGFAALYHRFEVLAFGWDAQFDRIMFDLLGMGIDAIYSDHVDLLVAAVDRHISS